ncbi:hypothetical protein [Oceanobacter mangrovi]|uniref:hypothetical protein n=1 Tax=Oceanobacter mangrovi TaxID=2862510 RepID=UPI001C8E8519|nr:hypothetical protein [Oceanobacter mangrovi]
MSEDKNILSIDQWLMIILIIVTAGFGCLSWVNSSELLDLEKEKFKPDYMYKSYEPPLEIAGESETFFTIENVGSKRGYFKYYISSQDFWLSSNGKKERTIENSSGIQPQRPARISFSLFPPEANPKPEKTKLKISIETSEGLLFENEYTYQLVNNEKYVLLR